jgi:hypothetical protein
VSARLLLYLSARSALRARWRSGTLADVGRLSPDEEGWSDFNAWLLRHPNTLISILVDTVDEDYRLEWLPHTWGGARTQMVARKLRQTYFNSAYRAALHLGRSQERRRDDAYLFMALTAAEMLRPWLEIIAMRRAPLEGIQPLPLASQYLLGKIGGLAAEDTLFLSRQSAGLRLSYFSLGRLRFSRLAGLEYYDDLLASCVAEIAKTRQFLINQRWLGRDSLLSVLAMDPSDQLRGLCGQFSEDSRLKCRRLDSKELATLCDLPENLLAEHPEIAHLAALVRQPPMANFAPPALLHGYRVYRAGRMIHAASLAALSVLAGLSIWNLVQEQSLREESDLLRHAILGEQRLAETIRASLPATPVPPERLHAKVALAHQLEMARRLPTQAWLAVSKAMTASPRIALTELSWHHGRKDGKTSPVLSADSETLSLTGSVTGITDRAQRRQSILDFKRHLERQPGIENVRIARWPADLDPLSPLTGQSGGTTPDEIPAFELEASFARAR